MPVTLGFKDLEKLWVQQGGAPQYAPLMAGIALSESGGDPTAVNNTAFPGLPRYHPVQPGNSPEYSVGLWQINLASGYETWASDRLRNFGNPSALANPSTNANAARSLLGKDGSGLSNWRGDAAYGLYTTGGLGAVLQRYGNQQGSGSALDSPVPVPGRLPVATQGGFGTSTGTSPGGAAGQITGAIHGVESVGATLGKITSLNFLYRAGEVALGGLLTLMGLYLLARQVGLAPSRVPSVPLPSSGGSPDNTDELAASFDEGVRQGERAQARAAGRRSVAAVPETASEPGRAARERRERIRAEADANNAEVPF